MELSWGEVGYILIGSCRYDGRTFDHAAREKERVSPGFAVAFSWANSGVERAATNPQETRCNFSTAFPPDNSLAYGAVRPCCVEQRQHRRDRLTRLHFGTRTTPNKAYHSEGTT